MKYVVHPRILISLIIALAFIAVTILALVDPATIKGIIRVPADDAGKDLLYTGVIILGMVLMILTVKHKKPYRMKERKGPAKKD